MVGGLKHSTLSTLTLPYQWLEATLYTGGTSQDVKRLNKMGLLPSILWVLLTIYIFFALLKITMCFKHLEASHIMSCDS